jgi:hypothetical protein
MCQKPLEIWLSLLEARQAPERLSVAKLLRSLGRELMRVFLQCLEWLQPVQIDLSDGFGSISAGLTSSAGSRALEGDFFEFGSL